MNDRTRNLAIIVVVTVALALVVFLSASANTRAGRAQDSTGNLAAVLNRRSPTLEYLACKDVAHDAFDVAQGRLVLALISRNDFDIAHAKADYQAAIDAVTRSQKNRTEGGCGDLPLPADSPTTTTFGG